MGMPSTNEVTQLLLAWSDGDKNALERLTPLVYAELHRIASHYMRRERGRTYLANDRRSSTSFICGWWTRTRCDGKTGHIFLRFPPSSCGIFLVDFARSKKNQKRGGEAIRIPIEDADIKAGENDLDLVDLDEALNALADFDQRKPR